MKSVTGHQVCTNTRSALRCQNRIRTLPHHLRRARRPHQGPQSESHHFVHLRDACHPQDRRALP